MASGRARRLPTALNVQWTAASHRRRALTEEEFQQVLSIAGKRRIIYLTAAYTGLRANELRQLIWGDLHFEVESPYIRLRASTTKNRQEFYLPLHPQLVEELLAYCPEEPKPSDPVFRDGVPLNEVYRRDLKKAGISYRDDQGRVTDFHSLCYLFATLLAKKCSFVRALQGKPVRTKLPSSCGAIGRLKAKAEGQNFFDFFAISWGGNRRSSYVSIGAYSCPTHEVPTRPHALPPTGVPKMTSEDDEAKVYSQRQLAPIE